MEHPSFCTGQGGTRRSEIQTDVQELQMTLFEVRSIWIGHLGIIYWNSSEIKNVKDGVSTWRFRWRNSIFITAVTDNFWLDCTGGYLTLHLNSWSKLYRIILDPIQSTNNQLHNFSWLPSHFYYLNGINIASNDDQLSLLILNQGCDGVDARTDHRRALGGGVSLSLGLSLGTGHEPGLFLLLALRPVLVHKTEQLGGCKWQTIMQ